MMNLEFYIKLDDGKERVLKIGQNSNLSRLKKEYYDSIVVDSSIMNLTFSDNDDFFFENPFQRLTNYNFVKVTLKVFIERVQAVINDWSDDDLAKAVLTTLNYKNCDNCLFTYHADNFTLLKDVWDDFSLGVYCSEQYLKNNPDCSEEVKYFIDFIDYGRYGEAQFDKLHGCYTDWGFLFTN